VSAVENRVLVTGASGFIGRAAARALAARGLEVHGVSTAPPRDGVDGVAKWHAADLLRVRDIEPLVRAVGAESLLHLAWVTAPGAYSASPMNGPWVDASRELVERFTAAGGARVVVAGSCAEYDWSDERLSERDTPIDPATAYGEAKARLHAELSTLTLPSLAWARIFFTFGPHEHPDRLVSSICRSLLAGEPAALTDGAQSRDFLGVGELGSGLAELLAGEVVGPVNVASGTATPVRSIAERIGTVIGRPDLLRFGERSRPEGDPDRLVADVIRLTDEVGWRPRQSLAASIDATVSWWQGGGGAG